MPKTLLEKCCVRLTVQLGQQRMQGTGVIIALDSQHYILTAAHCICRKDFDFSKISLEHIIVEHQDDYQSSFRRIAVRKIEQLDHALDFGLIEIEDPQLEVDYSRVRFGSNFLPDDKVYFAGYQNTRRETKRIWDAKVLQLADNIFRVSLEGKSFEQGGNLGAVNAAGLSGSGAFIVRGDSLFLVGHLKNVDGQNADSDDVSCCRLSTIDRITKSRPCTDMGDLAELGAWEKAADQAVTQNDIDYWIATNDKYFENLLRKSKVLYGEEKGKDEARGRLLDYLMHEHHYNKMRNTTNLLERFEQLSGVFEKLVKRDYTRQVETKAQAKDLSIKLQREFSDHIASLTGDKSNPLNLELAIHKTTWWLLNCSFDFTE